MLKRQTSFSNEQHNSDAINAVDLALRASVFLLFAVFAVFAVFVLLVIFILVILVIFVVLVVLFIVLAQGSDPFDCASAT